MVARDPRVRRAPVANMQRVSRRPQNPYTLRTRPFSITPFMCHPVLPGETLKNVLIQARVVSDPLDPLMKLTGWWCETMLFYVKHRDLSPDGTGVAATAAAMVLDQDTDMTSMRTAPGNIAFFQYPGAIAWNKFCYNRIVDEYFRDGTETFATAIDSLGYSKAALTRPGQYSAYERVTLAANKRTDNDVDLIAGGSPVTPLEFTERWQHWATLRDAGLMDMDYQDFVNTYGVETREAETSPNLHRPEILYQSSHWQYASNVVEPTTGVPAVAAVWSLAERSDKAFLFNEPGFIYGIHVVRPKMYLGTPEGSMNGAMDNLHAWLPAVLAHNYEDGYVFFDDTPGPTGPLGSTMAADYWVDIRDLFTGGDLFRNYTVVPDTTPGFVALPTATGATRYASDAAVSKLFKTAGAQTEMIRIDGICHLGIAGAQRRNPGNQITI